MSKVPPLPSAQKKQRLEDLFNAMYHGKRSFADFASARVEQNFAREKINTAGKTREIQVPNDMLKGFHEFVRLFVLDFLPLNERVVFSYRKGASSYDAVAKHRASKAFFVCDIANFFPSLRRSRVQRTLAEAKDSCPIQDLDYWLERIVDLVCVDDSLPVGFSTSPGISNAALRAFDDALEQHCQQGNLIVTRYSDDVIVSGPTRASLEGIEASVATILHTSMLGELVLHPKKSRFMHQGGKVKLLGIVRLPNGTLSVDASVKDEIEVLLHFYASDRSKFVARAGNDAQKAESRLSGLINYVNAVDKVYLDKLRRKFGAAAVDFFLHRSFS